MSGNKRWTAAAIAAGLIALAGLIGCGGEESVASKSAAAFEEARKKGETFGGEGHGHDDGAGHQAPPPSAGGHEGHEMPDAAPGTSTGHQHGTTHESHPGPKGESPVDHSAMGHGARPDNGQHAGHGAPAAPAGSPAAAGGNDHAGHSQPAAPVMPEEASAPEPEAPSPGQPARTLSPDALDSPAATSVMDAQRSEAMAKGGSHAGHGGTYTHVDAGLSEAQAPAAEPHQHAVYSCPMHPEVTSNAPGTCPKCGMALVK